MSNIHAKHGHSRQLQLQSGDCYSRGIPKLLVCRRINNSIRNQYYLRHLVIITPAKKNNTHHYLSGRKAGDIGARWLSIQVNNGTFQQSIETYVTEVNTLKETVIWECRVATIVVTIAIL